jgi:pyruvate/2-oxoglutarate dehydrogenase complex dihydrolipoamide acyltransferase (E2) component
MSTLDVTVAGEFWKDVDTGTEALVDAWLVAEGDEVAPGQPLVNVVLVKANHEVLAPAAGVIEKILVRAEQTFAQGQPLATLRTA